MRRGLVVVAVLSVLALIAGGVIVALRAGPGAAGSGATGAVDASGVHLAVGGVTVDAPPSVAPVGTVLTGTLAGPPPATAAGAVHGAAGAGVDLAFAGGRQPEAPVTLTFPSSIAYTVDRPSAIRGPDDVAPFVLTRPSGGGPPVLVPARFDPVTHEVTADVSHFSTFWEKAATARDLMAQVVGNLAGSTPRPSCAGRQISLPGTGRITVDGPADDKVWVCVRADGGTYSVELTNNSPEPWDMRAAPRATLQPQGATELPDVVALAVARQLHAAQRNAPGTLPVRGSATYTFPQTAVPAAISLAADPGTLLISEAAFAMDIVGAVFGINWVKDVNKVKDAAGCMTSAVASAGHRTLDAAAVGDYLRALFGCFGPVAESLGADSPVASIVVAIAGTGVGLIVSGVAGAIDTLKGPYRIDLTGEATATRVTRLAAVDPTGHVRPGWTAQNTAGEVECGYTSAAAVSDGIQECTPYAAGSDVCWPEPGARTVLCLQSAWSRTLDRYTATAADTAVTAPAVPSPVGLELSDGTRCRLRFGGAWSSRTDDENLVGAYSCGDDNTLIVWASGSDALDRSSPRWTVQVGTDVSPLRRMAVTTAYVAAVG